ncbi:MAG: MATE family efflux transporter [Proteobacteria bacterium]|nr:MATE family efflux transporter [Pseudomonadota bacterium]
MRKRFNQMCQYGQACALIVREAMLGTNEDFTDGPVNRAIVLLAIPMMLEMLMESVFAIVDIFFVSRLGADAIATLGITEAVITLLYAVAIGLSMAVAAVVARRIGERNIDGAAIVAGQALWIGAFLSIGISVAGVVYADDILRAMGLNENVINEHAGYTSVMFGGCGSILFLFLLNGVFRGAGDASIAMRSLWFANGINIVLDPCLIFGLGPFPELGLAGAAVATTTGRSCGVLLQLYYLFSKESRVRLSARHLVPRFAEMLNLLRISVGGIMQFFIATSSWIFLMKIMASYGSVAVAGYTVAIRIVDFVILPAWGLSNAASTLVGQNLGAHQPDRAEQFVWRVSIYNFVFLMSVGMVFILLPRPIVELLTEDPEVIAHAASSLRWLSYGLGVFAIGLVLNQAFNGAGDTMTPTIINFAAYWIVQLPLAYWLTTEFTHSTDGIFIAILVATVVMAGFAYLVFRRGHWKLIKV